MNSELRLRHHRFAGAVDFQGLVWGNGRAWIAVGDQVFDGEGVATGHRAVNRPVVSSSCHEAEFCGEARWIRFRVDAKDRYLAKRRLRAGTRRTADGDLQKLLAPGRKNEFQKKMFSTFPFGCTEKELVALFESEALKRRLPTHFVRENLHSVEKALPEYSAGLRAFLLSEEDDPEKTEVPERSKAPAPSGLDGYLLQLHRSGKENAAGRGGREPCIEMKKVYTIKREFLNYSPIFRTARRVFPAVPVLGDGVPTFTLDEADLENRRGWAYLLRRASFNSLPLLGLYCEESPLPEGLDLEVPGLSQFKFPYKGWDNNPRFNYGVCALLSRKNRSETLPVAEERRPSVLAGTIGGSVGVSPSPQSACQFELAGNVYALGLLGLVEVPPQLNTDFGGFIAQVSRSRSSACDYSLLPLPETLLERTANVIGLGFSFRGTGNRFVAGVVKAECSRFGLFNRAWVDEWYRICAGLSLSLIGGGWVSLDDKLVEILYNGLTFFGTNNEIVLKRLRRGVRDRLEEIFYSSFFSRGVKGEPEFSVGGFEKGLNLCDLYRNAGLYFYIGVCSVLFPDRHDVNCVKGAQTVRKRISEEMMNLCLCAEEEKEKDLNYKFLFDILLISVSLVLNGTSDIDVIRVIRRQLLKVDDLKNLEKIVDFVDGRYETQYGLRYGDYIRYKMCLGVLYTKIEKNSLFEIVAAFYINFPICASDQKCYQIYRHLLVTKAEKVVRRFYNDVGLDIVGEDTCTAPAAGKKDKKLVFDSLCKYLDENGADDEIDLSVFGLVKAGGGEGKGF